MLNKPECQVRLSNSFDIKKILSMWPGLYGLPHCEACAKTLVPLHVSWSVFKKSVWFSLFRNLQGKGAHWALNMPVKAGL